MERGAKHGEDLILSPDASMAAADELENPRDAAQAGARAFTLTTAGLTLESKCGCYGAGGPSHGCGLWARAGCGGSDPKAGVLPDPLPLFCCNRTEPCEVPWAAPGESKSTMGMLLWTVGWSRMTRSCPHSHYTHSSVDFHSSLRAQGHRHNAMAAEGWSGRWGKAGLAFR